MPVHDKPINNNDFIMNELNFLLTACLLTGASVAVAGFYVLGIVAQLQARLAIQRDSRFDKLRLAKLRQGSALFNYGESLVNFLAQCAKTNYSEEDLNKIDTSLKLINDPLPWLPEEHLAMMKFQAYLVAFFGFIIGFVLARHPLGGLVLAPVLGFVFFALQSGEIHRKANLRRMQLKGRLSFVIDLMALMMESGATFGECLVAVSRENADHPIGQQFGDVLCEIEMGRPRKDALLNLQQRMSDEDFTEFIFAVVKGEELGTPLSDILRNQADLIRSKHSQRLEKESAEAQVSIIFPGMLIMLACLLIIMAPFLLQAIESSGRSGGLFQ